MTPGEILDILHALPGITDVHYGWSQRDEYKGIPGTHFFGFARLLKGERRSGDLRVTEEFLLRIRAGVGPGIVRRQIEQALARSEDEVVIGEP